MDSSQKRYKCQRREGGSVPLVTKEVQIHSSQNEDPQKTEQRKQARIGVGRWGI